MLKIIKYLLQKKNLKLTRKDNSKRLHLMTQEEREDFFKEGSEGL
jgi:hypothetical protein